MVNLVATSPDALAVKTDFPHEIRIDSDLQIPLPDGRFLSARLWIPTTAESAPVPAVIEYAPFRHRDFTYPRDAIIHPWFAGHGYASIRLEPAGAMDSDGTPLDEYVFQEQQDCVDALAWIAAQPWCSGSTGMFGMSWGAFSALQVAALRPPSLKAIIPVHGTDERFGDDIHYKGGCLLTANLAWGALYQTYMARPPHKASCPGDWKQAWINRIDQAPNILEAWVGHQRRDEYWRHASVMENPDAITAATFVICGWADGYTNAALRMVESLTCPHKVLIGPWAHTYPHIALPSPQIDFLDQATAWWDRWLKGVKNGAETGPKLVYYMQESVPPAPSYEARAGRWIGEETWPSPHSRITKWHLGSQGMTSFPQAGAPMSLRSPVNTAMTGWEWLPHGVGPEMPLDQRAEDAGALTFDTDPLDETVELCGQPVLRLRVSPDKPRGTVSIRLSDVQPDGQVTLITYGLLNLVHREGFETPVEMVPGSWYDVTIPLNGIAQAVPAEHRLRISVGTQSWPLTWPAAEEMTLQIETGANTLDLPVRMPDAPDGTVPDLGAATIPSQPDLSRLKPVIRERTLHHDLATGRQTRRYLKDDGAYIVNENNQLVDSRAILEYSSVEGDPLSARADLSFVLRLGDADDPVTLETQITVTADRTRFFVRGNIVGSHEGGTVHRRCLDTEIPRSAS